MRLPIIPVVPGYAVRGCKTMIGAVGLLPPPAQAGLMKSLMIFETLDDGRKIKPGSIFVLNERLIDFGCPVANRRERTVALAASCANLRSLSMRSDANPACIRYRTEQAVRHSGQGSTCSGSN